MKKMLLEEKFRLGLYRVVLFVDAAAQVEDSVAALQDRYNRALQRRSARALAPELGLSPEEMEQELTPRLRAASRLVGSEAKPASAQASDLTVLRALAWMEVVLTRKEKAKPELLEEEEQPSEEHARKQLRALELILRAFVSEAYPNQQALVERLRFLFKTEVVDQWLAKAQPGDVLTGTVFQDLAQVFTHQKEWPRYDPVYNRAEALTYLRDKRKTIRDYLDDVRVIRNHVAHCKDLSAVQIELLDTYYAILVDPIQQIFFAGQTGVDPRRFLEVDKAALEAYFTRLQGGVEELGKRTRAIELNLEEVHTDVGAIGHRTRSTQRRVTVMVMVLLAAVGATIYAVHRVRREVAHDYKSLGWVVLSAGAGGESVSVQGEAWMGDEETSFGQAKLRAVARRAGVTLARYDLGKSFVPTQHGGHSAIAFTAPPNTDTVVTCFSIPSASLGDTYTVVQRFGVLINTEGDELPALAAEEVLKGDSGCVETSPSP